MHAGKSYTLKEVILWTRRNIYKLIIIGTIPVIFYEILGQKWIGIPWVVVALLGTATAFIVGFRNSQTYNRTWEARQIWGGIINISRTWGVASRDYFKDNSIATLLIYRHLAWLTALRFQMREKRNWETTETKYNSEYRKKIYSIPEDETTMASELKKYLSAGELNYILSKKNKATHCLSLQSKTLKEMYEQGKIDSYLFNALENHLKEMYDLQGKSERIKNFPYPRQFATINQILVKLFCLLLPLSMLKEFDKLNESVHGIFHGYMIWLSIPFSVLVSWVFTSLDQVGESTENPFEGSSNDVPITQICRTIEIDMREMLDEKELPDAIVPHNNIVL